MQRTTAFDTHCPYLLSPIYFFESLIWILILNCTQINYVNYVNLKRSFSVDKQNAAKVNKRAITLADPREGFLARPVSSLEVLPRMLFSKQSAKALPPAGTCAAYAPFAYGVRVEYCLWCAARRKPFVSSSRLLSLTSPSYPLTDPSVLFSPLTPPACLQQSLDQKTALIWFSRLTFRAPGAWRTLSFVSLSRSLFSILSLPSPLHQDPARDQVRRRHFRFFMHDDTEKKKLASLLYWEDAHVVDRCNIRNDKRCKFWVSHT